MKTSSKENTNNLTRYLAVAENQDPRFRIPAMH